MWSEEKLIQVIVDNESTTSKLISLRHNRCWQLLDRCNLWLINSRWRINHFNSLHLGLFFRFLKWRLLTLFNNVWRCGADLSNLLNWVLYFSLKLHSLDTFVAGIDFSFNWNCVSHYLKVRGECWVQMGWYRIESLEFFNLFWDLLLTWNSIGYRAAISVRKQLLDCLNLSGESSFNSIFVHFQESYYK